MLMIATGVKMTSLRAALGDRATDITGVNGSERGDSSGDAMFCLTACFIRLLNRPAAGMVIPDVDECLPPNLVVPKCFKLLSQFRSRRNCIEAEN